MICPRSESQSAERLLKSIRELLAAAPERLVRKDTDLAGLCREGGRLGAETPRAHSSKYIHVCTDTVSFGHMHVCAQNTCIHIHMPPFPAMSWSIYSHVCRSTCINLSAHIPCIYRGDHQSGFQPGGLCVDGHDGQVTEAVHLVCKLPT